MELKGRMGQALCCTGLCCHLLHTHPIRANCNVSCSTSTQVLLRHLVRQTMLVISVSAKHVEDLNRTLALGITLVQQTGVAMAVIWGANQHWEAVIVCLFIGCSSN